MGGTEFFNGWKLWEKMVFVLACSIVLVIFIGYAKVLYTNRKMRKLDLAGARAIQQPQMIEAAHPTNADDEDNEVPFGIRAIQSGIEVDGIWISGNNTPAPSSPVSSASSMPDRRTSVPRVVSNGDVTRLEMPPAAHGSSSRTKSRGRPVSSFDRAVSAERLSNSRASSAGQEAAGPRGRQRRPPPIAYSRYSQNSILRHSATLASLEGDGYEQPEFEEHSSGPTRNPSNSSSENNPADYTTDSDGSPIEESTVTAASATQPRSRDPKTDLRLLQSHRLSHVAETGSLARRDRDKVLDRPPGRSGEWSSVALEMPKSQLAYPTASPPSSSALEDAHYALSPFRTPPDAAPVTSPSRDNHPANKHTQAVPLLETYQPSGPAFEDVELALPEPSQRASHSQGRRLSQVLRKVNSGFEILRPGSFQAPEVGKEDRATREKNERRGSKRLQKKGRRPSTGSRRSSLSIDAV